MTSTYPAAAILQVDLGPASKFDPLVFPLAYYEADDHINKGNILIAATLEEMDLIKRLGIDLNKNVDFIYNTRIELEALVLIHGLLMSAHVIVA